MAIPPFPGEGEKVEGFEEVSLEELLLNRRGIAEGSSESGLVDSRILPSGVGEAREFFHASKSTIEAEADESFLLRLPSRVSLFLLSESNLRQVCKGGA